MLKWLIHKLDLVVKNPWLTALLFVIIALFVRCLTITPPLIDHDESTYLVIANEWLKGAIPFVDYVDIKPVGIYGIYAVITSLFGQSIIGIRLFTVGIIGLTGFFLYRAKFRHLKNKKLALICGVFYVLLISIDSWGWSGNTEVFFNFFTAIALFILMQFKTPLHAILVGLLMGFGFIIKYHILFDFTAFILFVFIGMSVQLKRETWSTRITLTGIMGLSFLVPISLVFLYYQMLGYTNEFIEASIGIPSRYNSSLGIMERIGFVATFFLFVLPLSVMVIMYFLKKREDDNYLSRWFSLIWLSMVCLALLLTGKTFQHYYIQALIPICFFGFDYLQTQAFFSTRRFNISMLAIFFIMATVALIGQSRLLKKNEDTIEVVSYLSSEMKEEDLLYSQRPVLNYVLDKSPPNRYIHNTIISNPEHVEAYQIDKQAEIDRIIKHRPKYMFCYNNGPGALSNYVITHYTKVKSYSDGYNLWKRN